MSGWKPTFDPSPEGIASLAKGGPYGCRQCGREIELPGICDGCGADMKEQAQRDRLKPARTSIPRDFRCMRFDSPMLTKACGSPRRVSNARICTEALMAGEEHVMLLDGPTGTGKTSLACAVLQHIIDTSPMGPGCRFVFAPEIARAYSSSPMGSVPRVIETCHQSRVLLIDDLGQDSVYRDNLRTVIQTRIASRRPTIITTFLTEQETEVTYGGGISRRLFSRSLRLSTQPAPPALAVGPLAPSRDGDGRRQGSGSPPPSRAGYGPAKGGLS